LMCNGASIIQVGRGVFGVFGSRPGKIFCGFVVREGLEDDLDGQFAKSSGVQEGAAGRCVGECVHGKM